MKSINLKKKVEEVERQIEEVEDEFDLVYYQKPVTPIQEVLEWLEDKQENVSKEEVKQKLLSLLEKEKGIVKYAFNDGFFYSDDSFNGEHAQWRIHNEDMDDLEFYNTVAEEYYERVFNNKD